MGAEKIKLHQFWLIHISTGREWIISSSFTIGRSNADVRFPQDQEMSGTHCKFELYKGKPSVEDLNSKNGVYINGKKLKPGKKYQLKQGLKLKIGEQFFKLYEREMMDDDDTPIASRQAGDLANEWEQSMMNRAQFHGGGKLPTETPNTSIIDEKKKHVQIAQTRVSTDHFEDTVDEIPVAGATPKREEKDPNQRTPHPKSNKKRSKKRKRRRKSKRLKTQVPELSFTVSAILILVSIYNFISGIDVLDPNYTDLIRIGGNISYLTTDGQWWRLFTSIWIHGGILHLFGNVYALLFVGRYIEAYLDRWAYLIILITSGIFGSFLSVQMNPPYVVSVGASGGIFGLFGALIAILMNRKLPFSGISDFNLKASVALLVIQSIGIGKEGIDVAAHIGGLIFGFVFASILVEKTKRHRIDVTPVYLKFLAVTAIALGILISMTPKQKPIGNDALNFFYFKYSSHIKKYYENLVSYDIKDANKKQVYSFIEKDFKPHLFKMSQQIAYLEVPKEFNNRKVRLAKLIQLSSAHSDYVSRYIATGQKEYLGFAKRYDDAISKQITEFKKTF